MRSYVLGFAFDSNDRCVLIDRNKDDWQQGRINGLGGSIEEGETAISAMMREFREECGVETASFDWRYILTVCNPEWKIAVFKGQIDESVTLSNCEEGDVFWAASPPPRMDPTALWLYWLCRDGSLAGFNIYQ
ncbi:MAG: NUDIX domain-containing protein [Anaerolineales bacterium]|nr:NUDIX domain-containing protein [Anaerolineales bacterium]